MSASKYILFLETAEFSPVLTISCGFNSGARGMKRSICVIKVWEQKLYVLGLQMQVRCDDQFLKHTNIKWASSYVKEYLS